MDYNLLLSDLIVTLSKYLKLLKEHNHNFFPQELLSISIQQNIPV